MADSTTNLDGIIQGSGAQDVQANALYDAASPAMLFGRRASTCTGLTWGYYGGNVTKSDNTQITVANGTVVTTASSTNYIAVQKSSGTIYGSTNTTYWNDTANYWRLYIVIAGTSSITSYTDEREIGRMTGGEVMFTPIITITTQNASYTTTLSDGFKYIRMDVATANNLTVPPNSSVAYVVGTQMHVRQVGAGQTTIVPGSGVTITTAETLKLRKQHSTATLIKTGSDLWELTGDLETTP